jgi:hypothetical protein
LTPTQKETARRTLCELVATSVSHWGLEDGVDYRLAVNLLEEATDWPREAIEKRLSHFRTLPPSAKKDSASETSDRIENKIAEFVHAATYTPKEDVKKQLSALLMPKNLRAAADALEEHFTTAKTPTLESRIFAAASGFWGWTYPQARYLVRTFWQCVGDYPPLLIADLLGLISSPPKPRTPRTAVRKYKGGEGTSNSNNTRTLRTTFLNTFINKGKRERYSKECETPVRAAEAVRTPKTDPAEKSAKPGLKEEIPPAPIDLVRDVARLMKRFAEANDGKKPDTVHIDPARVFNQPTFMGMKVEPSTEAPSVSLSE